MQKCNVRYISLLHESIEKEELEAILLTRSRNYYKSFETGFETKAIDEKNATWNHDFRNHIKWTKNKRRKINFSSTPFQNSRKHIDHTLEICTRGSLVSDSNWRCNSMCCVAFSRQKLLCFTPYSVIWAKSTGGCYQLLFLHNSALKPKDSKANIWHWHYGQRKKRRKITFFFSLLLNGLCFHLNCDVRLWIWEMK